MRRLALIASTVLFALACARTGRAGPLDHVEDDFEKAIRKVSPATVVVVAGGIDADDVLHLGNSSGVIVSRKGLVLSDGDAGVYFVKKSGKAVRREAERIEIRIPELTRRGFEAHEARVVARDRTLDTSLIEILDPPRDLPFVSVGNSDDLQVGDFAFAMGNAFGLAAEAPPTLTAGLVASLVPFAQDSGEGRFEWIYTSAAVNRGVNGGPLVDVEGRLIGTVSGPVPPVDVQTKSADQPYQFLGRVVPIERLKAFYAEVEAAQAMFDDASEDRARARKATILETVFHRTGRRAYEAVVSLEVERKTPFDHLLVPTRKGILKMPRHAGAVSGILISEDGLILTSLYNLANVALLVEPAGRAAPPEMRLSHGLESIQKITAHLPGGRAVEAELLGRHEGLGVALLGLVADEGATTTGPPAQHVRLLEPVEPSFYETGRFVLAVANPFGSERLDDPLLAFGILSKQHPPESTERWAGQWQTDASVTDATCGGAAVDLEGRLIGMLHIWYPARHGRNSGIGFVVPWTQIEPVLDELEKGRVFALPLIGVTWQPGDGGLEVKGLVASGAAAKAGIKEGDLITRLGDVAIRTLEDAQRELRGKWSGDTLSVTLRRGGEELDLELVLGARH